MLVYLYHLTINIYTFEKNCQQLEFWLLFISSFIMVYFEVIADIQF